MVDVVIELLKEINIPQLVAMGIMGWSLYNRLDKKITDSRNELKSDFSKLSNRIDNLSEKVEDIDRRLCRIEGSLSTHGHCLFKQQNEKVN